MAFRERPSAWLPLVLAVLSGACEPGTSADGDDAGVAAGSAMAADGAMDSERAAAASVAEATLAALSAADTATLRRLMHPAARLVSLSDDPSVEPRVTDLEQFLASVGSPAVPLLERMWSPTVHVDGRLATVWTPYDFYRGGEFSHCGVDVFTLGKLGGDWRVLSIAYTVHREGCEESPLGPPM